MTTNPLSALAAAELAAAASPVLNALKSIKNGDGTVNSVIGQGVVLQGELLAILPTLQKIGISNVAGFLETKINEALAAVTPATAGAATEVPEPAPEVAPVAVEAEAEPKAE